MKSKIAIASMILAGLAAVGCDSKSNDEMNKAKEPTRSTGVTTMPTMDKSTMDKAGDKMGEMKDKAKQETKDVTNKMGDMLKDGAKKMETTQPAGQP